MHSRCLAFFPFMFWRGCGGGGGGGPRNFLIICPGFPMCSQYFPFKFPMGSHDVPMMFPNFECFSPHVFHSTSLLSQYALEIFSKASWKKFLKERNFGKEDEGFWE